MDRRETAVEILLQIREDLRGLTATNAGMTQLRTNMAATAAAARQNARSIDAEFSQLGDSIKRKFSAKDIGMSLLGGLGIGSAFGIANTVIAQITAAYEEHQATLKRIDDTWASIIAKSKAYNFEQLTPLEKRAQLEQRLNDLIQQRNQAVLPKTVTGNIVGAYGVRYTATPTWGSTKEREDMAKMVGEIAELAREIEKIDKVMGPLADPKSASSFSLLNASNAINAEAINEQLGQMQRNGRSLLDLAKEANANVPFYFNPAEIEAAAVKQDRLTRVALQHMKVWADTFELIRDAGVTQAMENNERYAEQANSAAMEMGWAFSSAFERAILDGEKLSDVLRGLARDIAQVALRTAVTQPLGEGIGNWIKDVFKLGGGGTFVTRGPTTLTVGDNPGGAELVSVLPLSGVGTSTHNGRAVHMAGGGALLAGGRGMGREITVVQHLNITTGVQGTVRAELIAMLPMFRELAQDSVREGLARGDL